jgi:hypothetical protein
MVLEGGGPDAGKRNKKRRRGGSGSLKTTLSLALLFAGENAEIQFSVKRTGCRRLRSRMLATYVVTTVKIGGASEITGMFCWRSETREGVQLKDFIQQVLFISAS